MLARLVLAALLFLPASVQAADITGSARVIDGDTIEVQGQRIRLHGIDAPESDQLCQQDGQRYRCDQQAAFALDDKIADRPVRCDDRGVDQYGRTIGVCRVGGDDLNAWLVAAGWALAYRQYSLDYVAEEAAAKAAGNGIWRGAFVAPWDWRRGARLEATTPDVATGCLIKGNISSKGERIYHVPGGQYYDRTLAPYPLPGTPEGWLRVVTVASSGWPHPGSRPSAALRSC